MSKKEKEISAYHEAGHAMVGHVLPDSDLSTRLLLFHAAVPVV